MQDTHLDSRETKRGYRDWLNTREWREFSAREIEKQGGSCWSCGSEENLVVHHLKYCWSRKPWEYDSVDLRILCSDCHKAIHKVADLVWVELLRFEPHALELILKRLRKDDTVDNGFRDLVRSIMAGRINTNFDAD